MAMLAPQDKVVNLFASQRMKCLDSRIEALFIMFKPVTLSYTSLPTESYYSLRRRIFTSLLVVMVSTTPDIHNV